MYMVIYVYGGRKFIMKKKYLLFLAAACLLAGCGTDKAESQNENKKLEIDADDLLLPLNYIPNDPYANEITEADIDKLVTPKSGSDYTKNDDGTYTFMGEQYKNMLDLSGDLGDAHLECKVLANEENIDFSYIERIVNSENREKNWPFVIVEWKDTSIVTSECVKDVDGSSNELSWVDEKVNKCIELCGVQREMYMEFTDKDEAVEVLKENVPEVFEKIQKKYGYKTIDDNNWEKYQIAYSLNTPNDRDTEEDIYCGQFFDIYENYEQNERILNYIDIAEKEKISQTKLAINTYFNDSFPYSYDETNPINPFENIKSLLLYAKEIN